MMHQELQFIIAHHLIRVVFVEEESLGVLLEHIETSACNFSRIDCSDEITSFDETTATGIAVGEGQHRE